MDNFSNKVQVFLDYFIHHDGYKTVLLGLRNTAEIAMLGLLIGIVFGTVIATTRAPIRWPSSLTVCPGCMWACSEAPPLWYSCWYSTMC